MNDGHDVSLFFPGEWERRLQLVTDVTREMSRRKSAGQMLDACQGRAREWLPVDRSVAVSRRGLAWPRFRVVGSDLWGGIVGSSTDQERHTVVEGGVLAELLYAGRARIIERLSVDERDPGFAYLQGMGSLAAIPHFDGGNCEEMVVHLRRAAGAFPPEQLPELVLLSNLFGRALREAAVAQELRAAEARLHEQYTAVSRLSDTVLQQALSLKHHAHAMEEKVRERTAELEAAHLDAIFMLALASEAKDEDTGQHVRRIERSSRLVAREMGLDAREAESIGRAAVLHDVGKMHVPDRILKKPGPLTEDERIVMQGHTVAAERILLDRPYFATARRIARSHHENWDGSGYPDRLERDAIPLEARIVHLVDVYDALTSTRIYKPAWTPGDAIAHVRHAAGTDFDPSVVRAFVHLHARGELKQDEQPVDIAAGPS